MRELCVYLDDQPFSIVWKEEVESVGGLSAQSAREMLDLVKMMVGADVVEHYRVRGLWLGGCILGVTRGLLAMNDENTVTIALGRSVMQAEMFGEYKSIVDREARVLESQTVAAAYAEGRVMFEY